jgi:hypothetical protein
MEGAWATGEAGKEEGGYLMIGSEICAARFALFTMRLSFLAFISIIVAFW